MEIELKQLDEIISIPIEEIESFALSQSAKAYLKRQNIATVGKMMELGNNSDHRLSSSHLPQKVKNELRGDVDLLRCKYLKAPIPSTRLLSAKVNEIDEEIDFARLGFTEKEILLVKSCGGISPWSDNLPAISLAQLFKKAKKQFEENPLLLEGKEAIAAYNKVVFYIEQLNSLDKKTSNSEKGNIESMRVDLDELLATLDSLTQQIHSIRNQIYELQLSQEGKTL